MTDRYSGGVADISAFVADGNAINAATKTALNTALANIALLFGDPTTTPPTAAAHTDFNKVDPQIRALVANEITVLKAAVTAHA